MESVPKVMGKLSLVAENEADESGWMIQITKNLKNHQNSRISVGETVIFDNSSTQRESELIPYEDPNAPTFRTGAANLITVANHVFGVRNFETI